MVWKRINYWYRKLYQRSIQLIGSRFYVNPDLRIDRSILVAGTARSGTTWLAELIDSQLPCRLLFEPFNPNLVPEYRGFHYFQYMRPGRQEKELYGFARSVLTGEIRNRWVDHKNEQIFPEYRLIKEIRANLLLKWLHDMFPNVPIFFLIRHPCAVVLSRMELGWATGKDIESFLVQADLVEDHLVDHLDVISNVKTDEEKHAIIWSVSNLVPLKQFKPGEINIIFYENLCVRPEIEMQKIFDSIKTGYEQPSINMVNLPSSTSTQMSAVTTGVDKISRWKSILTTPQVSRILEVVDKFGLGELYGNSLMPLDAPITTSIR